MNTNTKVAVLLAAYNGREWIEEQLNSILNQNDLTVTIYISVDLSNDGTYELVQGVASVHKNIKILSYGERFGGAAPNFFRLIRDVDFSGYDYVSLADQDDIWNNDKLSNACKVLSTNNYDAFSSNVIAFWENGVEKLIDKAQPQVEYDYLFESAGPGCTFVFSKAFALELKFKVVDLSEDIKNIWLHDWFSYSFARSNGHKWYINYKSTMKYRQHLGNQVGSNIGFWAILKRVKEVLSGNGFKKVMLQAKSLNQHELEPIQLLEKNSRLSFLKLAALFRQCRRRPIEQCFFFVVCILMVIKGPVRYD